MGGERRKNAYKILVLNMMGRDCMGDLDGDGRIILKWILKKWEKGVYWTRLA
jgi:hypothetical protein